MKRGTVERPFEIFLVEDNPGDVDLIAEALTGLSVATNVSSATNGVDALAMLRRGENGDDARRPDLIFLDLNVPRKDGREVLAELKADPELKLIPVVVLTSSEAERDLRNVYGLHANCLVSKPVDLEEFLSCVQETARFWLSVAKIPNSTLA
jgi:two-component system, chemotaxis family, response regulator Rcp1